MRVKIHDLWFRALSALEKADAAETKKDELFHLMIAHGWAQAVAELGKSDEKLATTAGDLTWTILDRVEGLCGIGRTGNPKAGSKKKPWKYQVRAYDGDRKAWGLMAYASEGHRIHRAVATKKEVLEVARAWMREYPPQKTDKTPSVEITDNRGDRQAVWTAKDGVWVQSYNHLESGRKANPSEFEALREGLKR